MSIDDEALNKIISHLKSGKIRTIEISQSEKEQPYVRRCFKDISTIQKFHYRDKNTLNYKARYFGCIIDKKPIYLFLDDDRNRIVFYTMENKEIHYLPKNHHDYNAIKNLLISSRSAIHYININNKIKNAYKPIWIILIALCAYLLFEYAFGNMNDSCFGTITLNIVIIMALYDCINVYLPRFERKHCYLFISIFSILSIVALLLVLALLFVSGAYNAIGHFNNIISIILTIGTLMIKFDNVRQY